MNDRTQRLRETAGNAETIQLVHEGMRVVDLNGDDIGAVEFVKMGDPNAATIGADAPGDGGFLRDVAKAFGWGAEPDLPATLRARLLRVGFIKVDGKGLTDTDRYVMADKIASVSNDTVRLTLPKNRLATEA
jgi:hypothetical protein